MRLTEPHNHPSNFSTVKSQIQRSNYYILKSVLISENQCQYSFLIRIHRRLLLRLFCRHKNYKYILQFVKFVL